MLKLYIVLRGDGTPKLRTYKSRAPMIYETEVMARRQACDDGDSVVEFDLPVKEPLFIRRKVVKP